MPSLSAADYAVILAYVLGMIALGVCLSRKREDGEDYLLAGRQMPWFAVGISVIASLLSSLTYLSEPGEVWKSGITHMFGKMLAIPFEMAFVWIICIPLMMRFQYTSAYEYLHDRFGSLARRVGVALFLMLVVLWMGFVVLATARALQSLTDFPLVLIIGMIGLVATIYTTLGGLRAVIWTDVVQVAMLVGGGVFAIAFVAVQTGTGPSAWLATAKGYLALHEREAIPLFSANPTVRATVVTVAINMFIWHVCTHVANQMTVQRYFSTSSVTAARRSFVTGSLVGVGLNLMLMTVGLAMLHYYVGAGNSLPGELDLLQANQHSLIFPVFVIDRLPPGLGGGILAALLAAAMSSIDSGVNSIATVLTVEKEKYRSAQGDAASNDAGTDARTIHEAQTITIVAGIGIAFAAYGLSYMPSEWGIVDAMPRTFNACTAPLGGMFLAGMFIRGANQRSVVIGALGGFLVAVCIGYSQEIAQHLPLLPERCQWLAEKKLSFTWVMPSSLLATLGLAYVFGDHANLQSHQRPAQRPM